ncbi:MAG TPA: hypothetical protein DEO84_03930 [candidate division Zixibacteria bacterium]|jgi:hypothetical protein|nr:hypothetical protein [candidate division Zixibacteria bacterium]
MKTLLSLVLSGLAFAVINLTNLYAQSPGDTIGYTEYVYQCNGSTGRRVVLDNSGGLHFTWMWSDNYGITRNVRYNCFGPDFPSPWPRQGISIGPAGSGYPQISVTNDSRAIAVYHRAPLSAETLFVATDIFQCQGTFFGHRVPNRFGTNPVNRLLWPYLTVDRNNRIHLVATATTTGMNYTYEPMGYTRSNNGGTTWTAIAPVDTSRVISVIVVSSKVSDKVAILYCHSKAGDTTSLRNDIYYIESPDGITWNNFADKVNITNYGPNSDSLYAWKEVSAVYDFDDNLHVIWNAQYVTNTSSPHFVIPGAHLAHWDHSSNTISYFADFPPSWPNSGCFMGLNNFVFAQSSIAVDSANQLYVAYTSWDSTDCSLNGVANGDIYVQHSFDGGSTWSAKENLTNSHYPGCMTGDCFSDVFPSLAEVANNYVHLFYVCDADPQNDIIEPMAFSTVLYLAIPAGPQNATENLPLPAGYSLSQNYPNPFNAQTIIKYNLPEKAFISLSIYDLLGRKITTLYNGISQPGEFEINWNASAYPSGVYFARLEIGKKSQSIRMMLLK